MSEKYTPEPANKYRRRANWDHKYHHQNILVDMDVWYPFLKTITFNIYFILLKYREAEANFSKNPDYIFTKEDIKILILLEKK